MGLNKNDRHDITNAAKNDGYKLNSDQTKLIKDNKSITFSESGGSVKVGQTTYNTSTGAKNSSNW